MFYRSDHDDLVGLFFRCERQDPSLYAHAEESRAGTSLGRVLKSADEEYFTETAKNVLTSYYLYDNIKTTRRWKAISMVQQCRCMNRQSTHNHNYTQMEQDFLQFNSGSSVTIGISDQKGFLVI